jgi:hypothetical protein
MITTRRKFIERIFAGFALTTIVGATSRTVRACMYGKWVVRCRNGHNDTVTDGTCQHKCDTCHVQTMPNGDVNIVCPANHVNFVKTGTSHDEDKALKTYKCRTCRRECRRD